VRVRPSSTGCAGVADVQVWPASLVFENEMEEHLRALGHAFLLRNSALRWFEYAVVVAAWGIAVMAVFKWQGVDYRLPAGAIFSLAGAFALVAAFLAVRVGDAERQARSLARARRRASR
jgi:hypothetical protein